MRSLATCSRIKAVVLLISAFAMLSFSSDRGYCQITQPVYIVNPSRGGKSAQEIQYEKEKEEAARKQEAQSNCQSLLQSLKKGNPSLTQQELETASEADVRKFFYNQFRAEGMGLSEAKEKAAGVVIPMKR